MSYCLTIQASKGHSLYGGDGYGYGVGEHLGQLNQLLEENGLPTLEHFIYEDPEDQELLIENLEALGRDTSDARKCLAEILGRPSWYDPAEALACVAKLREALPRLKLGDEARKELEYDFDCYQESLEDLKSKALRFRFR